MARESCQIGLNDARTMFDIVQECQELWADPEAWQTHLMRRTVALVGCRVGLCYEIADTPNETAAQMLSAADIGWLDESERRTLVEGISIKPLNYSPLWVNFTDAISRERPITRRQSRLIEDRKWFASEIYDYHIRPTRIGAAIMSAVWMPHRSTWSVWCLTNDRADGKITDRQELIAGQLHEWIAPLIGTRLCTANQRSLRGLSLRRREVLARLLLGQTEKEIALSLRRSHGAVHDHVVSLYKHFGVGSRAELSAYFINRRPGNDDDAADFHAEDWLNRSQRTY